MKSTGDMISALPSRSLREQGKCLYRRGVEAGKAEGLLLAADEIEKLLDDPAAIITWIKITRENA